MIELSVFAAFLVGLLGGGHCAGMCGGIVSAVTMTLPSAKPTLRFQLSYNLGRIASYTFAGLIAGGLGASSLFLNHVLPIEKILYGLANIMLIVLGLYLAGWWRGILVLERLGGAIWQYLQPYSKRFLPVHTIMQAFKLGLIWGWLPCGMVYSVLIAAIASGSPSRGGLLMLAFGIGTLPTLLAMGLMAVNIKAFLQKAYVRKTSGLFILSFGLIGMLGLFSQF